MKVKIFSTFFMFGLVGILFGYRKVEVPQSEPTNNLQPRASESVAQTLLKSNTPVPKNEIRQELRELDVIRKKALMSHDEKARIEASLSSSHNIRRAFLILSEPRSSYEPPAQNQHFRILAMNFLVESLRWRDNPARVEAAEALKNVIVLENLSSTEALTEARSLAGDKVEAYIALRQHFPDLARELHKDRLNPRLAKLVNFAEGRYHFITQNSKPL